VNFENVNKKLSQLDPKKSAGPDNVPPVFMKECSPALVVPLTLIFNKSLISGCFPNEWKSGNIVPIHKKGDKSNIENYRPICIQSTLAKLFESLVLEIIMPDIVEIVEPQQHGFVPGRSVLSNLTLYENYICRGLADGRQVDSIYTDFSKAFDKVSHELLLRKMFALGIKSPLIDWFHSYLDNRVLRVKIGNDFSSLFNATSGLPQGSHFGPILFLVFINDAVDIFQGVNFLLFADDLKIYKRIKGIDDCRVVQENLNALHKWCRINNLFLNIEKCKIIRFGRTINKLEFNYNIDGNVLETVHSIRDLGVVFDDKLSFIEHISGVTGRAMRTLGFVLRTVDMFNNVHSIALLYMSLVRSLLEYNSPIWSPGYTVHIENIERIQRKFLRFINYKLGIPRDELNYDSLLSYLSLEKLVDRRIIFDLVFLYKIVNSKFDCPELIALIDFRIPARSTRSIDLFHCSKHVNTNYLRNSVVPRLHRVGNEWLTNVDVFLLNLQKYKDIIKELFKPSASL
jgi:hypothetical protein